MKYCRFEHIKRDAQEIPDAEPFVAFRLKDNWWAFAMRINNQFTLTRFQSPDVDEGAVRAVKKQILFCKNYGWSYRGGKSWNIEVDDMEHEFMCLYCKRTTFDTSDPCPCRNKTTQDFLKKTPSGIILPF